MCVHVSVCMYMGVHTSAHTCACMYTSNNVGYRRQKKIDP